MKLNYNIPEMIGTDQVLLIKKDHICELNILINNNRIIELQVKYLNLVVILTISYI